MLRICNIKGFRRTQKIFVTVMLSAGMKVLVAGMKAPGSLEARSGIEPLYAALQAAA
jgi:hypothetical protein